jgi:hypothetical protein
MDDRLLRGGPVVKTAGWDFAQLGVSTDPRGVAVWNVQTGLAWGFDGTREISFGPGVAFKPASSVFIQLGPNWDYATNAAQYVTAVSDPTASLFYGKRYVLSYIATRTLSMDTRVNWTIKPSLTLQLYAQPFIATGDYQNFSEFRAPRTEDKLVYGKDVGTITKNPDDTYTVDPDGNGPANAFTFGNPNFTARSVRGTAVLRWEYREGSTLYFVWTQERAGGTDQGDFNFSRDTKALWSDRPNNIFQVKATYWIGR